jgi:hypothetical protein
MCLRAPTVKTLFSVSIHEIALFLRRRLALHVTGFARARPFPAMALFRSTGVSSAVSSSLAISIRFVPLLVAAA